MNLENDIAFDGECHKAKEIKQGRLIYSPLIHS